MIREGILGRTTLVQGQFFYPDPRGMVELPKRTELSEWWDRPEMVGWSYSIMGMGVHIVDLLQFLLGNPIVEVAAMTNGQTASQPLDDLAAIALRFQNGVIGTACYELFLEVHDLAVKLCRLCPVAFRKKQFRHRVQAVAQ